MNHPTDPLRLSLQAAFLCLLLVGGACASTTELQPATGATGSTNRVEVVEEGVVVRALGDRWPGLEDVRTEVTPLHLRIENRSDRPLEVRYGLFSLISGEGETFAAIPPFQVDGDAGAPMVAESATPAPRPYYRSSNWRLAPYYARTYPGANATSAVGYNRTYYDTYAVFWNDRDLPTSTMLERALAEGTIDPGGHAEGFLYFEHVPADADRVELQMTLSDPQARTTFGELAMPLAPTD